jgi:TM2 domain-containing membrane protein YozV
MRYSPPPKSPAAALLLSLFPGLGQIYNGQPAKALVFFFAQVASIYAASTIDGMPYGFFIPFVYLYNLVDAWRSASMINARAAGGGGAPLDEDGTESPAWGGTLMAIGVLLLLNNLGWFSLASLQRYWPVLLIVAGGALLSGSLRRKGNGGHAGV